MNDPTTEQDAALLNAAAAMTAQWLHEAMPLLRWRLEQAQRQVGVAQRLVSQMRQHRRVMLEAPHLVSEFIDELSAVTIHTQSARRLLGLEDLLDQK